MEKTRNPDQVQQPAKESLWLVHIAKLWTHVVNTKRWALRGLKKIANDA
jgi:hypothetical protein